MSSSRMALNECIVEIHTSFDNEAQCVYPKNYLLVRQDSYLHSRYIYTHSDCSSSLSSISKDALSTNNTRFRGCFWLGNWNVPSIVYTLSNLLIIALSAGLCNIHGVFESDYEVLFSQYNDESERMVRSQTVTLVGALQIAMFVLVHGSGLSYMLCRSLDSRLGALSGAVVSCGGLLAAGYANAVWQLCLAQGVLVGFGAAISTSAAVDVLDGVVLPRAVEEMLGGSAIITAAIGVGGGALSLCARQLAVTSSSSGIALRWLALVVFCGQLLGVVFMKGCADQGNCDGTLSDVDEDAAVCFDAQDVKADCCSGHMHRPDLSLDKPAPGTSLVGESRFGSMRRACTRVLETAQRAFGSRKLAASFLTDVLHHLGAFVPLMFLPGYVSTQLNNSQPLSGAVFLAIICFASAAGSLIGSFVASMIPAHVGLWQCASRLGLSLSVWCLWLPAADSWAMVYAFSLVYGLLLGSTNSASCSSLLDLDLAAARIRACGCCAAVLVGVPAAGCLFIGTELGDYYVPTVTFVASTSLLAAAVDAVTWWVLQRQEQ